MESPTKNHWRVITITFIIVFVAFSRVIPHFPNFSPLGAISLFGAAYLGRKQFAFTIPILSVWLSDLLINNTIYASYFDGFTWFYVGWYWQYGSYLLISIIGWCMFKNIQVHKVILGSAIGSIVFFTISNFGVWASTQMYPKSIEGLIACFIAGLPYLKGTVMGDLFYTVIFFGIFETLQNRIPALQIVKK